MPTCATKPVRKPILNPSAGVVSFRVYNRGISATQARIPLPNFGKDRNRRRPDNTAIVR